MLLLPAWSPPSSQRLPCDDPKFTNLGATCNQSIIDLTLVLKREVQDLLRYIDPVKMHISLLIPRIQDQKSTSTSVKEDLVEILRASQQSSMSFLESNTKYHVNRGKLVSKMLKFPLAADYCTQIRELDYKHRYLLLNMLTDTKNNYAIIYDMVSDEKEWMAVHQCARDCLIVLQFRSPYLLLHYRMIFLLCPVCRC